LSMLDEFCHNHLLHWVEVCSLLGNLQGALIASTAVHHLLAVCLSLFFFLAFLLY
jgi:hypothetical protein